MTDKKQNQVCRHCEKTLAIVDGLCNKCFEINRFNKVFNQLNNSVEVKTVHKARGINHRSECFAVCGLRIRGIERISDYSDPLAVNIRPGHSLEFRTWSKVNCEDCQSDFWSGYVSAKETDDEFNEVNHPIYLNGRDYWRHSPNFGAREIQICQECEKEFESLIGETICWHCNSKDRRM